MRVSSSLAKLLLSGLIVLATVPVAFSQGGRGGGGPGGGRGGFGFGGQNSLISLAAMKEVRDELKVDDVQSKELDEISKELGDAMREMFAGGGGRQGGGGFDDAARQRMQENAEKMAKLQSKADEKLSDILDPKQMDRLLGLLVQRSLTSALANSQISAKLNITEDQKTKFKELDEARRASRGGPGGGGPGGGGAGGPGGFDRERFEQMRKENEEKVLAVLTADQKKSLEDMKGAKFEFPAPNFGGGRRGGNN